MAHNLQKMKKYFSYMSLPQNLLGRRSWSKKLQLYFKNYDFCEYVKFGEISWKFSNCIVKIRIKKSFCTYMWLI